MLKIRRYQPKDNADVKALHYAGLKRLGAAADPFYDSDLDDIEGTYLNNNGDFIVGVCGDEFEKHGFTETHRRKVGPYDIVFYEKKLAKD